MEGLISLVGTVVILRFPTTIGTLVGDALTRLQFIDGRHRPARLDGSLQLISVASPVHRMR